MGREQADHYASAPPLPEPMLRETYGALRDAVVRQWNALVAAGFRFEPWHGDGEPYATSDAMRADLDQDRWLWYLPTAATPLPAGHPMNEWVLMNYRQAYGVIERRLMVLNDVFRVVHDAMAHGAGHSFGPKGERAAYAEHRRTLPRSAHLALWNETTAQNLWTNYGPHMWRDGQYLSDIPLRDRPFAHQRVVDAPSDWL